MTFTQATQVTLYCVDEIIAPVVYLDLRSPCAVEQYQQLNDAADSNAVLRVLTTNRISKNKATKEHYVAHETVRVYDGQCFNKPIFMIYSYKCNSGRK